MISSRKRLRKSSTGSGSGSAERTSEDHASEVTLTSPGGSTLATVIKADPGSYTSENSTPLRSKQHSSDSEPQRGSSHDSVECDPPLQITLQVPQQDTSHNLETQSSLEVAGPSAVPQQNTGYQWGVVEGTYPRFTALTPCHSNIALATEISYNNSSELSQCSPTSVDDPLTSTINTDHISNSPPNIMQKRKRSINPQADENFVRALDAVRFGGIGFCKAAKMYGVNNRTLWLEYKKRGYPNHRISIKNRKQEFINPDAIMKAPENTVSTSAVSDMKNDMICTNQDSAIVGGGYVDSRHVDLSPFLHRHLDVNSQQPLGLSAVSFDHM